MCIGLLLGAGLGLLVFGIYLIWKNTPNVVPCLALLFVSVSVFGVERTSVRRDPVGAPGAITSVNVTVKFHDYGGGFGLQSYRATWTENVSGALVGSRMLAVAPFGSGNWTGTTDVTSAWSTTYVAKFNASAQLEDPQNKSGWNSPSPLNGFAWNFAPPHDTAAWLWDSGNIVDGEEGGPTHQGPWNYPAASGLGMILVIDSPNNGNISTILNNMAWPQAAVNTVPVHCRGVRAYIRVENNFERRFVSLVWDEYVSDEVCYRYIYTILKRTVPPANWTATWTQAQYNGAVMELVSTTNLNSASGSLVFNFAGYQVNLQAGTQGVEVTAAAMNGAGTYANTGIPNFSDRTQRVGFVNANSQHYQQPIQRFRAAYLRDHAVSRDVVADALSDSSPLAYYPAEPTGALTFDYSTKPSSMQKYSSVPLFDRCSDSGTGGGSTGGGTGSGWSGPTDKGLPNGAGSKSPTLNEMPNFGESFGLAIGSWDSFSPTTQEAVTIQFDIPWVDGSTQSYFFTSVPSSGTPMGSSLNQLRMLVRTALTVFVVWQFLSRVYRDLVTY